VVKIREIQKAEKWQNNFKTAPKVGGELNFLVNLVLYPDDNTDNYCKELNPYAGTEVSLT
jgi:hypothetical protein